MSAPIVSDPPTTSEERGPWHTMSIRTLLRNMRLYANAQDVSDETLECYESFLRALYPDRIAFGAIADAALPDAFPSIDDVIVNVPHVYTIAKECHA